MRPRRSSARSSSSGLPRPIERRPILCAAGLQHRDSRVVLGDGVGRTPGEHFADAPGGFVLLIALFRWRRWEARLFLALVCFPQTPGAMSALPLLLIPKTLRGMLILALLGFGSQATVPFVLPAGDTLIPNLREIAIMTMWTCYFPALFYLMRLPPHNESMVLAER